MSTAHRPTFVNAVGKNDTRAISQVYSSRDLASQTVLKFRKPGQTSTSDIRKRDLRAELILAEAESTDWKRKAAGLPSLELKAALQRQDLQIEAGDEAAAAAKRRRILAEAAEEDKDDDDDDEDEGGQKESLGQDADEESDSDEEEEDDTAELMRELAKIKRERAEEQAKKDADLDSVSMMQRGEEIARGNPLLNLANALGGQTPSAASSSASGVGAGFVVKRRWDDDLVFKNQANQGKDKNGKEFVNDLLRSDFHRSFLKRFIA